MLRFHFVEAAMTMSMGVQGLSLKRERKENREKKQMYTAFPLHQQKGYLILGVCL